MYVLALTWGLTRGEWITAVIAFLQFLVTLVYVIVTYFIFRSVRVQAEYAVKQTEGIAAQVAEMKSAGDQTRELLEQAKHQVMALDLLGKAAIQSADVASLTAQRLTQIEGSQVVPVLDWRLAHGRVMHGYDNTGVSSTGLHLSLICRNDGKRSAWVTEERLAAGIFDQIPPTPDFVSGETIYHGLREIPKGETFQTNHTATCDGVDELGKMIVVWGIVKYSDTFSDSRIATFGYWVTVDNQLNRIDLPAYNQST